jgi:Zn-dependent protease
MDTTQLLFKIIFVIPSILIAFIVHEICHGYAAYLFGDPTAKYQGRLKLDPRIHLDPFGALVLLFSSLFSNFTVGWAKPVSVNPYNFRNPRTDTAWVAFAGPLSNFAMAALAGLFVKLGLVNFSNPILYLFVMTFVQVNIGLGLFNLLPFPPLDGSKVLYGLLPSDLAHKLMDAEMRYAQIIPFILIIIILSPIPQLLIVPPYIYLMRTFTSSF